MMKQNLSLSSGIVSLIRSRDSSALIVTGYELDDRDSINGSGPFFSFPKAPGPALGSTQTSLQCVSAAYAPRAKRHEQ